MSQAPGAAYKALLDLAQLGRSNARGLPAQIDIKPHWSGVGFSLLGQRFVAPMGDISEMLEVPSYTHLPGVQSWVRGVANVRGRLLPLFDMAAYVGGKLTGTRKQRRVLILDVGELYSGLVVDRVFGMQHFPVDTYRENSEVVNEGLSPYVSGSYELRGQRWSVFNPLILAEDPRFTNVAQE